MCMCMSDLGGQQLLLWSVLGTWYRIFDTPGNKAPRSEICPRTKAGLEMHSTCMYCTTPQVRLIEASTDPIRVSAERRPKMQLEKTRIWWISQLHEILFYSSTYLCMYSFKATPPIFILDRPWSAKCIYPSIHACIHVHTHISKSRHTRAVIYRINAYHNVMRCIYGTSTAW